MIADTTLQTPFLSDLVTMADPTSAFSFLNYLKQKGRLYPFYIRENFHPSRKEFSDYCGWAASQLTNIRFQQEVCSVTYDKEKRLYVIAVCDTANKCEIVYLARRLILGTGTTPYIPACADTLLKQDKPADNITHTSQYIFQKSKIQCCKSITVVGSGQSAAEVFYDLLKDCDQRKYQLNWITRSSHFFPLDLSKLTLEMTSPDYANYFYGLGEATRETVLQAQRPLYKGINESLIRDIYHCLYERSIEQTGRVRLVSNSELQQISPPDQGADLYRAQQSIRTMFNISAPHKHYVKTALSVLNMGFMRGLSPEYMSVTPAINQWLADLLGDDEFLNQTGFTILQEVAAIGYWNPTYRKEISGSTGYGKMLSALWRESPQQYLKPGEKLMTMAALLHTDADGKALTGSLIAASGQSAAEWIRHYLNAYYVPLIHCFYHYDLAFMPHGENLIMVLKAGRIERMLMKDISEEIGLLNSPLDLPQEISRIQCKIDEALKANYIFTDVFDGFFRHLSSVLEDQGLMKEQEFWALVAEATKAYQSAHPHNADKYQRYNLFHPVMTRNCFNRLQLRNNRQMLDLLDPEKSFQFGSPMVNPLAQFA